MQIFYGKIGNIEKISEDTKRSWLFLDVKLMGSPKDFFCFPSFLKNKTVRLEREFTKPWIPQIKDTILLSEEESLFAVKEHLQKKKRKEEVTSGYSRLYEDSGSHGTEAVIFKNSFMNAEVDLRFGGRLTKLSSNSGLEILSSSANCSNAGYVEQGGIEDMDSSRKDLGRSIYKIRSFSKKKNQVMADLLPVRSLIPERICLF
jgi:hypothetical protein